MQPPVDTSSVPGRRSLRFNTPADALADAERLAAAHKAGSVTRLGNWSLGQALGHVAAWIDYAYDGYPFTPPPEMAARARGFLPRVLEGGMTPGFKIASVEGGTAGILDMDSAIALSRLHRAWARLSASPPTAPAGHAFFGPMTHEQWIALNLRHSELHQSFFIP